MAKFHSYYVLCPLIDQNSFLGINKDKENDNVLVTLGRNVVNKYRLSDQKQIGGWTSKDHITSAVVYDKEQDSYIGVFNRNTLKAWKDDSETLDKLKKYKFSAKILRVIPRQNQTSLIIFENGICISLVYGVENRKAHADKPIIKDSEKIVDVGAFNFENEDYICYIIKNREKYEILTSPLREELGDIIKAKLTRDKVSRADDVYVVGHSIETDDDSRIYFMWSDAKISIFDIKDKSWKNLISVPWISTTSNVSIARMGKNHLVLFGSNAEQDGAILVAYNVLLGVGSCRYPMKMYTKESKLYCFNNRIILQGSNHIAMLPYQLETDRNLSSLLGSHNVGSENVMEIADWGTKRKFGNEVEDLWGQGLPERLICSQIMSTSMEKCDSEAVYKKLSEFTDIPESVIVSLIGHTIKLINTNNVDVTDDEALKLLCSSRKSPHTDLLERLLRIPFSDALIITHLRNAFCLDDALFLMSFISLLLRDYELDVAHESELYDWGILLMDTFYQQYLMTNDPKVTHVLRNIRGVVVSLVDNLQTIDKTMPILDKLLHGTPVAEQKTISCYTIDLLNI